MLELKEWKLLPQTPNELAAQEPCGPWQVKTVLADVPARLARGASQLCRLWWENAGTKKWIPANHWSNGMGLQLIAKFDAHEQIVTLRHDVEPGTRTHFALRIASPAETGVHTLKVFLKSVGPGKLPVPQEEVEICSFPIETY